MRLFTGLNIGKEALSTHAVAINSVADNLANQNTPGFKSTRAEFETLLAESIGNLLETPLTPGNGVKAAALSTAFTQGSIEPTGRELDMAIDGNGFFIVRKNAGTSTVDYFTRAGNFQTDQNGNLITVNGDQVMGFTEASPTTLVPLNIRNVATVSDPTSAVSLFGNLNSSAGFNPAPATAPASFTELGNASEFSNNVRVIDSLGQSHDVAIHFFHTNSLTWTAQAYVDSADTTGTPGTPIMIGSTTITTSSTGNQTTPATPIQLTTTWANGSDAAAVSIDVSGMTGFAAPSNIAAIQADGTVPGAVESVSIDENGIIAGLLTNGERVTIGTVALADFRNVSGLEKVGNNLFQETLLTGDRTDGTPGDTSFGTLRGQALELSNVDPANEFVNMIQYQRGYQAGSQVITNINEIIKNTINII